MPLSMVTEPAYRPPSIIVSIAAEPIDRRVSEVGWSFDATGRDCARRYTWMPLFASMRMVWLPPMKSWPRDFSTVRRRCTRRLFSPRVSEMMVSNTKRSCAATAPSESSRSAVTMVVTPRRFRPSISTWTSSRNGMSCTSAYSRIGVRPSISRRLAPIARSDSAKAPSGLRNSVSSTAGLVWITLILPASIRPCRSQLKPAASRSSLEESSSNETIAPGSSYSAAPA